MKKSTWSIFLILSGCALLLSGIWIYFQKSMEQIDLAEIGRGSSYDKHYVLISDEGNSLMWQAIFESARQEAANSDAYLELIQPDSNNGYTQADYLNICIASQVDGIILKPDGTSQVQDLIDEAVTSGIPVITVLEDDSSTSRISFVGLNSYQMGDAYKDQILKLLEPGNTEVMVLINSETKDPSTNLIYSQMVKAVEQEKSPGQTVDISAYSIDNSTDFESEEVIRDIFVNRNTLPDILICMDEVATECTYQALVDYNEVGNVDIIGYYLSDLILDAVQKGTIPVTIALDTDDLGRYSINALEEYLSLGHASNYYSVGLNVITQKNAAAFITSQETQEVQP